MRQKDKLEKLIKTVLIPRLERQRWIRVVGTRAMHYVATFPETSVNVKVLTGQALEDAEVTLSFGTVELYPSFLGKKSTSSIIGVLIQYQKKQSERCKHNMIENACDWLSRWEEVSEAIEWSQLS